MYGSSFCTATLKPRSLSKSPVAAAVTPLPTELTTPPVKNKYFVVIFTSLKIMVYPYKGDGEGVSALPIGEFFVSCE